MDEPIRRMTYGEELVRINQDTGNENLRRIKRLSADLIDVLKDLEKATDSQAEHNLIYDSISDIVAVVNRCRHLR